MTEKRWRRGDTVVLRYPPEDRMVRSYRATTGDSRLNVYGLPHVVIQDTDELVALFIPEGTQTWRWNVAEGRFREPRVTQGHSVRLLFPGKPFEVSVFYETGSGPARWVRHYFPDGKGPFYGWKVDLTSPFGRSAMGFDVIDEVLDIVVTPDRTYRWLDEDEMAHLIELGLYTEDDADEVRDAGRAVIKLIEAGKPPFDDEWVLWRPPQDLMLGPVPEGWQYLPVPAPYRPFDGPLT
jgi:hypothetical protein